MRASGVGGKGSGDRKRHHTHIHFPKRILGHVCASRSVLIPLKYPFNSQMVLGINENQGLEGIKITLLHSYFLVVKRTKSDEGPWFRCTYIS